MDCANGVVNVRSARASMSWNPRPPSPEGVVNRYHACVGSWVWGCFSLSVIMEWMKCLVISLMVLVKVVL